MPICTDLQRSHWLTDGHQNVKGYMSCIWQSISKHRCWKWETTAKIGEDKKFLYIKEFYFLYIISLRYSVTKSLMYRKFINMQNHHKACKWAQTVGLRSPAPQLCPTKFLGDLHRCPEINKRYKLKVWIPLTIRILMRVRSIHSGIHALHPANAPPISQAICCIFVKFSLCANFLYHKPYRIGVAFLKVWRNEIANV